MAFAHDTALDMFTLLSRVVITLHGSVLLSYLFSICAYQVVRACYVEFVEKVWYSVSFVYHSSPTTFSKQRHSAAVKVSTLSNNSRELEQPVIIKQTCQSRTPKVKGFARVYKHTPRKAKGTSSRAVSDS